MPKPPTVARLTWKHALVFDAVSRDNAIVIDSDSREGPSPVQTLAISLVGCMSMDVAHILTKGRHVFSALTSELVAERAPEDPHRFTSVTVEFIVAGDVPDEAVARAIQLSHEKYCSVWHSMRQDIRFSTTFRVIP